MDSIKINSEDYMSNVRGTGRTFRILLDAAKLLSEGNSIILLAWSNHYAHDLKHGLLIIMSSYLNKEYVDDCSKRIKCMSHDEYERGNIMARGGTKVVSDHHHKEKCFGVRDDMFHVKHKDQNFNMSWKNGFSGSNVLLYDNWANRFMFAREEGGKFYSENKEPITAGVYQDNGVDRDGGYTLVKHKNHLTGDKTNLVDFEL